MTIKASQLGGANLPWHKQEFLTSGTFTVPADLPITTSTGLGTIYATGCGGGSAGTSNYFAGAAGAGIYKYPIDVTPGSSLTINIGSGSAASSGSSGGNTQIGSLTIPGGGSPPNTSNTSYSDYVTLGGWAEFNVPNTGNTYFKQNARLITPYCYSGSSAGGDWPPHLSGAGINYSYAYRTYTYYAGGAGMFGNGTTTNVNAADNSGAGGGRNGAGGSGRVIIEWQA